LSFVISQYVLLHRITAVDANNLYDFMVIVAQQRNVSKSSVSLNIIALIPDRMYFSKQSQ